MKNERKAVAVGMSGGVDSTVTAYLLKESGHHVTGIIMKIWDGATPPSKPSSKGGCYGPGEAEDIAAAKKAAQDIGIPIIVVDLTKEYKEVVLAYFRAEYLAGRTPNPCVVCNQEMKFGLLLNKASAAGIKFDLFATGHYARVGRDPSSGRYILRKAVDLQKDQSYFLYRLRQEQLAKVIFPLGEYKKADIKRRAAEIGFKDYADKPESQDFYEGDDLADFFTSAESRPGDIVDMKGRIVGQHRGIVHYTIGQRKGLSIGGLKEPLYVVGLDSCRNTVIVGAREDLYVKSFTAVQLNCVSSGSCGDQAHISVKTRLHSPDLPCTITSTGDDEVKVVFDSPQMSVTPGQSAVFYSGDVLIAGGVIRDTERC